MTLSGRWPRRSTRAISGAASRMARSTSPATVATDDLHPSQLPSRRMWATAASRPDERRRHRRATRGMGAPARALLDAHGHFVRMKSVQREQRGEERVVHEASAERLGQRIGAAESGEDASEAGAIEIHQCSTSSSTRAIVAGSALPRSSARAPRCARRSSVACSLDLIEEPGAPGVESLARRRREAEDALLGVDAVRVGEAAVHVEP